MNDDQLTGPLTSVQLASRAATMVTFLCVHHSARAMAVLLVEQLVENASGGGQALWSDLRERLIEDIERLEDGV